MSLFTIALKSIRQRLLASSLTALSVALGVALMIAVLLANNILQRTFNLQQFGYDLIVGPKGSQLELVLSTVYRIAPPIENLPWRYYEELKQNKQIATAVPVALGDRTEEGGFPILGTTVEYFNVPYAGERRFRTSDAWPKGKWESVVGSQVARENGWKVGQEFRMVHAGQDDHVHDERFTVVGILEQTGTPNDRTVFVNLEGFFAIAGHEKPVEEAIAREAEFFGETYEEVSQRYASDIAEIKAHDHSSHDHEGHDHATPNLQKEVTAILIRMKSEEGKGYLAQTRAIEFSSKLREGFQAQAVNPMVPMQRLMTNLVGNVRQLLLYLTGVIIVVSGISIFVSIYNSMSDRRREIAIMRALGADRMKVFTIILLESITLCLAGGIFGILLGHGGLILLAPIIEAQSGLAIDPLLFDPKELILIPVVTALAVLIGFLPGLTAYRTDVAENL